MSPLWNAGALALDEHVSYWTIDSVNPGTIWSRSLSYAANPPLFSWIQSLFLKVFGKTEFVLRFPSALAFVASVVVVSACGRNLGTPGIGSFAALILAWHPDVVDEVRIARCYGQVLLLSSLVVHSSLSATGGIRSRRHWPLLVWTATSVALLWTHYTSALLVCFSSAWMGYQNIQAREGNLLRRISPWIVSQLVIAACCLPLLPAVMRLQDWGPFLNFMATSQPLWNFIGAFWWAGVPMVWASSKVFALMTRKTSSRDQINRVCVPLAAMSLVPLLVLFFISTAGLTSLANPRYRIAYTPAASLLMSLLLTRIPNISVRTMVVISAGLLVWSQVPLLPWQTGRLGSPSDDEWRDVSRYLQQNLRPSEILFVQSGLMESHLISGYASDAGFLEYTACRVSRFYLATSNPRIGLPFFWDRPPQLPTTYQSLLQPSVRDNSVVEPRSFWIAAATDTDLNRNSLLGIKQLADKCGFRSSEQKLWPGVTLERYTRNGQSADPPSQAIIDHANIDIDQDLANTRE